MLEVILDMVFNKKKKGSRRGYFGKKKHKRRSKTVPFEMLIAGAAIPLTPPRPGWWSPVQHLQAGQYQQAAENLLYGFTGFHPSVGFDMVKTINPFDLESARYSKMLFWSAIIGKVRKRIAPQSSVLFKKIPLIGRWVS